VLLLFACSTPVEAPATTAPSHTAPSDAPLPPPIPGGPTSGAALQDPTGFPHFHDLPAPPGPAPGDTGAWSRATRVTTGPAGGYRPQVAVGPDGAAHLVYYDRVDAGDLIRYRTVQGGRLSGAERLGFAEGRNWGPDLVVRDDGSVVVVFDLAGDDMASRGYVTVRTSSWSEPLPLTPEGAYEIGSGHVADGLDGRLAYVFIGKPLDPKARFRAQGAWFDGSAWSSPVAFNDGRQDAWHFNVERRPDGSVLGGYDVGMGGTDRTTLYVVEGRAGRFGGPEQLTTLNGERPHFAFAPDGTDHVTFFRKDATSRPQWVHVVSGTPGSWGDPQTPSAGVGGFHFDPDIAVAPDGTLCLVWGWDAGDDAELLYSLHAGQGWSPPAKIADVDWGKPGLPSLDVDADGRFHVVWNQGVAGDNAVYYATLEP